MKLRQTGYKSLTKLRFRSPNLSSKKSSLWVPGTPRPTIYQWLFQLDDSKSLYRTWLFHQTSIYIWLFGVPGGSILFLHVLFVKNRNKRNATIVQNSTGCFNDFFCFWAHPLVAVLKNPPKKKYGRNGKLLGRSACEDVGSDDLTCWLCQNTWGFHHCGHSTFEKWIRMKSLICFKKGIPGYISWQIRKNPSRLYSMIPILIPQKKLTWNLHRT